MCVRVCVCVCVCVCVESARVEWGEWGSGGFSLMVLCVTFTVKRFVLPESRRTRNLPLSLKTLQSSSHVLIKCCCCCCRRRLVCSINLLSDYVTNPVLNSQEVNIILFYILPSSAPKYKLFRFSSHFSLFLTVKLLFKCRFVA